MIALEQKVDSILREKFHLATVERLTLASPPPMKRVLRYFERLFKFSDPEALPSEIAAIVARKAKPGDDTVFWRVRPEIDHGRCNFRFAVGRAE